MIFADPTPNHETCPDCGGEAMNYGGDDFTCECGFYFEKQQQEAMIQLDHDEQYIEEQCNGINEQR